MRSGCEAGGRWQAGARVTAWAWAALALVGLALPAPTSADRGVAPATQAAADTVVLVVRHAEKVVAADQDGKPDDDPPLSPAGEARAAVLSEALADADVRAIYSTPLRRTRQTAAPLAARAGLQIATYDPHTPAAELVQRILREHRGDTVLVVGHSNTVPDIVAALAGTEVEAMEDATYGRLYVVTMDAAGKASLLRLGFPPGSPAASP